jgi:hypothetical protein
LHGNQKIPNQRRRWLPKVLQETNYNLSSEKPSRFWLGFLYRGPLPGLRLVPLLLLLLLLLL